MNKIGINQKSTSYFEQQTVLDDKKQAKEQVL